MPVDVEKADIGAVFTTVEVSRLLGKYYPTANPNSIARWCERGFIKGFRPGPRTRWLIPRGEVVKLFTKMGLPATAVLEVDEARDAVRAPGE